MPDNPQLRDTALALLLAQALESKSKSVGDVATSACPDVELLAAYAERSLAEEETARWESHFADCSRCQKIIAVLVASDDELSDAEVAKLGNLAAASSPALKPAVRKAAWWTLIWSGPAPWRWLIPAAGLASAAGLWFALHQAPPRETLSAQKIAATAEAPRNGAAQTATGASSAKPDETQAAQANLPRPPEPSPRSDLRLRDKETAPAESSAAAKKEQAQKQETVSNAVQQPRAAAAGRALDTREQDAKDNRLQLSQPAEPKAPTSDALSAAAPAAPAAAPAPPPARDVDRAERQAFDRATRAPAAAQLKAALAKAVSPPIVFGLPNRRALWRLTSGGSIEHSIDQGKTWQPQSSGVTADLLAGAALSETVAWAVGRRGTILRTDAGKHWQRIALPQ